MSNRRSTNFETLFRGPEVLTVTEITRRLQATLRRAYSTVLVEGQVTGFVRSGVGHWYFTLKDAESQLPCAFFRQGNQLSRFVPENGMAVRVRGSIGIYAARGHHQLVVEVIEPVGVGALHVAYEQLRRRLDAEGLFDERRKRPIPRLPRRIGIVTSREGAVLQDILHVLGRRNPQLSVVIAPTRVQGAGAAREIAAAIGSLNQLSRDSSRERDNRIDVMIVGRGGGSMEDLWAFNEEEVARAIAASEIPVISAVGHETDFTIADFVADLRAATPSVAAERVTAGMDELRQRVDDLENSLRVAVRHRLDRAQWAMQSLRESRGFREVGLRLVRGERRCRELEHRLLRALPDRLAEQRRRLDVARSSLARTDPRAIFKVARARVLDGEERLTRAIEGKLRAVGVELAGWAGKLDALSPLGVLARGYLIARCEDGRLVTRAATISPGDSISLRFADGTVNAVASSVDLVDTTERETSTR
ncbi:MAG: exodeoxyribonuclease VII large subunit [Blastocatellia bacterium]|jgi:exodeoxyribonuclease VII large subunit